MAVSLLGFIIGLVALSMVTHDAHTVYAEVGKRLKVCITAWSLCGLVLLCYIGIVAQQCLCESWDSKPRKKRPNKKQRTGATKVQAKPPVEETQSEEEGEEHSDVESDV